MKLLANPYVLLGLLAAFLFVGAAGYKAGYKHAENAAAADKAAALTRAIAQADAVAQQDAEVLGGHEAQKERIRTIFRTIHDEVTRYVETHAAAGDCLDADGLRIWRDANAGRIEAATAPQPDYTLRGPAAATLGARPGSARQPRADGGAVPRLQGAPAGAGGVGEK